MKYIRTKNRIYDEAKVNLIADAQTGEIFVEKMIDSYTSHLEQVINQADTIEELCDEIVVKENPSSKPKLLGKVVDFDENGEKYYTREYSFKGIAYTLNELMERYKEMSIKGAIWTDGGLNYVTEFNNTRGE